MSQASSAQRQQQHRDYTKYNENKNTHVNINKLK